MKFIVNADDCGYSVHVNEHIKTAIALGHVSSTTIMANMNDFEGKSLDEINSAKKDFKHKFLSKRIQQGIRKELDTQILKILDSGVEVSHIDGHHHIHTAPFILPIVIDLAKHYGIRKIRRVANTGFKNIKLFQFLWMQYVKSCAKLITPTHFYGFDEFLEISKRITFLHKQRLN